MKIAIVGSGMIGLCSAYYLNKQGYEVTVIDEGDGSNNCSFGNAGFFSPSHMVPLASPGIVAQGLKWMTNPESPFYIKPSLDVNLAKWSWQFFRASTKKRVNQAVPILNQMLMESRTLIEEILANTKIDAGFDNKGLLMYCKSQHVLDEEAEIAELARQYGQAVDILSSSQAEKLNPGFEIDTVGAVHFKNDAWFTPNSFMSGFQQYLKTQGVAFQFNTKVLDAEKNHGHIKTLLTEKGKIEADQFVIATGSWTAKFLKQLGIKILLQGGKGYSFEVKDTPVLPKTASILTEARVAVTPMQHGLRFAGTMEVNGLDLSINPRRVLGIQKSIPDYFPQFNQDSFADVKPWAGLRPCSPDGMPYIGKTKKFDNLIVATGHAMLGISLGPVTGQLVCEIAQENTPHLDDTLLAVERYS
ncbi:D-amino-acid dehydrogenase [Reichenbachiella faecimaris]|uniref:D-amino-acid dehydrogenase n=1 Tax=Reichenbachiella faecimaris TaxID=692418 RepID=A0A1W2GCP0_REIFA|nr:FAD-dependent oxidoreductase [Reichenbachiella faecimaris]SMD34430.1 D-amino-acid dehydrogenase [Reichenbachiella faecimaris]